MTAPEYLRKYCKVVSRRQTYYKRFFVKYDKDKDGVLSVTEMEKAMSDVFNKINPGQVKHFLALTSEANGLYDSKLFYAVCALAERVFYSMYYSENPIETYSDKPCLEMADVPVILSHPDRRISEPLRSLFTVIVSSHGKLM